MGLTTLGLPSVEAWLSRTNTQSIANNAFTDVQWENELFDNHDMFDSAVSNTVLNIPIDGLYLIEYGINWTANSTGLRIARVRINGAATILFDTRTTVPTPTQMQFTVTGARYLVAGDTIALQVLQNSTVALNLSPAGDLTYIKILMFSLNQP